jgi:DNA transformation protein and related proteins
MARGNATLDHAVERLAPLGAVTSRAMFGGHGIYLHGRIFALVPAISCTST